MPAPDAKAFILDLAEVQCMGTQVRA